MTEEKPEIVFRDVEFSHKKREILLKCISLTMEAGKTTAIVGSSGSGKSSLIDLILRLHDVDRGAIEINSHNIQDYDIHGLREKIGFVSQDTFIFNSTIQENIVFGGSYTREQVIEAAKLANAYDFIMKLPQQFDTVVGDRGVRLSGGERQRIAIARAIIRKPGILILDEATSSLDYISEKLVQDTIDDIAKNSTTIIVAHRLSTIKNADIIYVLKDGRIIENGTHEQLMNMKKEYWQMYNTQHIQHDEPAA